MNALLRDIPLGFTDNELFTIEKIGYDGGGKFRCDFQSYDVFKPVDEDEVTKLLRDSYEDFVEKMDSDWYIKTITRLDVKPSDLAEAMFEEDVEDLGILELLANRDVYVDDFDEYVMRFSSSGRTNIDRIKTHVISSTLLNEINALCDEFGSYNAPEPNEEQMDEIQRVLNQLQPYVESLQEAIAHYDKEHGLSYLDYV